MLRETSVAVIIVTFNGMKWIRQCLESLRTSDIPLAVYVVDNNSGDETESEIRQNFPEVNLISNNINKGFGIANNIGISEAIKNGAEYCFLLNQDAYVQADTISKLINAAKNNSDYGILSPLHCTWGKERLDEAFTNYIGYKNNADMVSDFILHRDIKEVYDLPFVAASGWLLTRSCLEIVGGFDPIFFYLGEDVNYCQRALYHKFKIGIVPDAIFYHDTFQRSGKTASAEQQLKYFDYTTKMEFGNILAGNIEDAISARSRFYKKVLLKYLLLLKFSRLISHYSEWKNFRTIIRSVRSSRKINVVAGPHYLKDNL